MDEKILRQLKDITGDKEVRSDEPMKLHTTFRIGGNARYFVTPHTVGEIQQLTRLLKKEEISYYIIGNGSNLLVSDAGYEGIVIQLCHNFNAIKIEGNYIKVQAGALLSSIAAKACLSGLAGFEFAAGIPGTVGGAVVMNAGAYQGEMKQVTEQVTALDEKGNVILLCREALNFGYRKSVLQEKDYIVLEVVLSLKEDNPESIRSRMEELKSLRIAKQPLEYPSAGSTFKRPEGNYAGKLIMEAGLKGFQIGDARISDKHCGFIINAGDATANDVVALMEHVKKRVSDDFGITLESEVKKLGYPEEA